MDMRLVKIVLEATRSRTLVAAARRLNMTQSALTKRIQNLEATIGAKVFYRSKDGLTLTPTGEVIARNFRAIQSAYANLERDLDEIEGGVSGEIRIGIARIWESTRLHMAIIEIQEKYSNIKFIVKTGSRPELLEMLRFGEIDMFFGTYRDEKIENMVLETVYETEYCIISSKNHPISKISKPSISDLANFPWIVPDDKYPTKSYIRFLFNQNNMMEPVYAIETDDLIFTINIVIESSMLACLAKSRIHQSYLDSMNILDLGINMPRPKMAIYRRVGVSKNVMRDNVLEALMHSVKKHLNSPNDY